MTLGSFTFVIASAPSAVVTFTPVAGLVAPVAAGTVLGAFSVTPIGWQGAISFADANGNPIAAPAGLAFGGSSPNYTLVASAALAAGTYTGHEVVSP